MLIKMFSNILEWSHGNMFIGFLTFHFSHFTYAVQLQTTSYTCFIEMKRVNENDANFSLFQMAKALVLIVIGMNNK